MLPDQNQNQLIADLFKEPAQGARRVSLRSGEALFDQDAATHKDMIWVESGELRIFQVSGNGSVRLAGIWGPGDWLGAAAVSGAHYCGRAVASIPTEVLVLPAEQLLHTLEQKPLVAIAFFKETARRLMAAYNDAARLTFDDCNSRLITTLISLSDSPAAVREGSNVTVRITHQQLAQAVGAARETISLALTELRRKHLLETGRNRLIFNPEQLMTWKTTPRMPSALQAGHSLA
ncbi:MAG TPA: Crp/Fnr family transcriptional regulator [Tepidisphaeraceae bacterium]|jgi:CRP/FNR family transcriptional regulator|nr:Crp/Fnr family transcriptional regulator [Tepidisphaeraceae bacterium]